MLKNIDETARAQFRLDTNCTQECEDKYRIMINKSENLPGARLTDGVSSFFRAVFYRGDAYIMASSEIYDWVKKVYGLYKCEWFCHFENLKVLDNKLMEFGYEIKETHLYFLPDPEFDGYEMDCPYELRWLDKEDIREYRDNNKFPHALCY